MENNDQMIPIELELSKKGRLVFEPCPEYLLGKPPRTQIDRELWVKISQDVKKGKQCEICSEKATDAHEQYQYFERHVIRQGIVIVQKLVGIIPVCQRCHRAIHFDQELHDQKKQRHLRQNESEYNKSKEMAAWNREIGDPYRMAGFYESKMSELTYFSEWDSVDISMRQESETNDKANEYFKTLAEITRNGYTNYRAYDQDISYLDEYIADYEAELQAKKELKEKQRLESLEKERARIEKEKATCPKWIEYHRAERRIKRLTRINFVLGYCFLILPIIPIYYWLDRKIKGMKESNKKPRSTG